MPQHITNLWVAGRCHAAESKALASSRVTVICMGMGEAAGSAAALAVEWGQSAQDLDVDRLQTSLLDAGAIILERAEAVLAIDVSLVIRCSS